jgi:hypothetical protein
VTLITPDQDIRGMLTLNQLTNQYYKIYETGRYTLIRVSTTTRQAPADYLQGNTRDILYLGYIKNILAS